MRTLLNGKRARYSMNCLHKNTFLAFSESSGSRSLFPVFSAPILFAEQIPKGCQSNLPDDKISSLHERRGRLSKPSPVLLYAFADVNGALES